jgi:ribosomal protein S27AE
MELICTGCKRNNHLTGNKFCYKCGSTVVEVKSECSCGYKLQSIDEFCPECGKGVVPATQDSRTCGNHGAAVVRFTGPACPFCLVLDDLEFTRRDLDRALSQLTANTR